jgi:amino acid adenylation domain-containing protein
MVHEPEPVGAAAGTSIATKDLRRQSYKNGDSVAQARSIIEMIAAQAAAAPGQTAVVDDSQLLTYGALQARANRLASDLGALGAGPERVVALVLPRSADLVIAALATLQAGAAYAPFDPATPAERLATMLEDAQPAVIVTSAQQAPMPPGPWATVALDAEVDGLERVAPTTAAVHVEPSDLAYVIYTSGSTGRPKGVEITHAGLLNLVRWHHAEFAVTSSDRAPLLASPGFDASVWEMWPYLTAGASLHVPAELVRIDAEALRDWLLVQQITLAFVATPMAERLLALPWPPAPPLRTLLTGGDTLHHRPPAGLGFTLVNNYGPTECTVVASCGLVPPDPLASGLPSIGWPIANVRAYVLDERRRLLRPGDEGELYIGGPGVARGYRNLPELTAERFIPDLFGPTGARLYRTGDRVRWLPDGRLAFLGRIDDQIKLRGHRIELDEIIAVLDSHPGIAAAAVTAWPGPEGELQLVAYVVAESGEALTPAAMRATLQARLPDYMVPAVFVRLEALPLTANGKVDRGRLPSPDTVEHLRDREVVAPRTAVEERLTALVTELLGVHPIGVADNFFLLGGHSLLGTQLIARLRQAFGVNLGLRSVFDHPTIEDLAAQIERAQRLRMEAA